MTTFYTGIDLAPPIEVFAMSKAFHDDPNDVKVNLTLGAYRDEEGKPWVLPTVQKVKLLMAQDVTLNHEYLPVLGLPSFCSEVTKLILGENSPVIKEGRAFAVQSLSDTGALCLAAEFLHRILQLDTFYYSSPTWGNYKLVFGNAGFTRNREYRYLDAQANCIDFNGMVEDIGNAPKNSVIILQACAHNPTGYDPNKEQWSQLADVIKEKNLFVIFDSAYQGFASGDLDNDAYSIRLFISRGFEVIVTQSYAKNFGLYNERIGTILIVANSPKKINEMKSQFTLIIRGMYRNPPHYGARIISTILNDPDLFEQWRNNLRTMSGRVKEMRKGLYERLKDLRTPGSWEHIVNQLGMFSYTGLNEKHCYNLIKKYHIYLLRSGRVNMCGLNENNLDYVANAIYETITTIS